MTMNAGPACVNGPAPGCCSRQQRRTSCSVTQPISPARTCSEAATQARSALRRLRDADASGEEDLLPPGQRQRRLTVRLPLPSPNRQEDTVRAFSQGDWPGGIVQRFHHLRPLIEEHLLSGYNPEFVGMLESAADGIGVWRAARGSMTVVCQVDNMNFSPFARLCAGEFGESVLEPQHTLVVVNPTWTQSREIGQLWDTKLRAAAAALIDDTDSWVPLYHLWDVRTAKGATGFLFRSWPHDWALYSTCGQEDEAAAALGAAPILVCPQRPSKEEQIEALNASLAVVQGQEKERKRKRQRK